MTTMTTMSSKASKAEASEWVTIREIPPHRVVFSEDSAKCCEHEFAYWGRLSKHLIGTAADYTAHPLFTEMMQEVKARSNPPLIIDWWGDSFEIMEP